MLPNLPLDVRNVQIRVGDKVCWGADNGSYLYFGTVYKITSQNVWMNSDTDLNKYNHRRAFRRVCVVEKAL